MDIEEDIQGAANWMEGVFSEGDRAKRWWLRENLGRISGIGKNWAFGKTYFFRKLNGTFPAKGAPSKVDAYR